MINSYVFDSFLPYLESIQLCRGVSGLLRLRYAMTSNPHQSTSRQLYTKTYFNLSAVFPQLADQPENTQNLRHILEAELLHQPLSGNLSSSDRKAVNQLLDSLSPLEWQELQRNTQVSRKGAEKFVDQGMDVLNRLIVSLKPKSSLFEDLLIEVKSEHSGKKIARLMEVWEQAKMVHEGYPPYFDKLTNRVVQVMRSLDSKFQPPSLTARRINVISPRRAKFAKLVVTDGQKWLPQVLTDQTCAGLLAALDRQDPIINS